MSLPFFDTADMARSLEPEPVAAVMEPIIEAVEMAEPELGIPTEERERLDDLLDELMGLKARLQAAREQTN